MLSLLSNKLVRAGCVVLTVGFLASSVYLGSILYPLFNDPFNDRAFDQALWHNHHNDTSQDNPRGKMAHHLATVLETQRMTRGEVLTLLGQPDAPTEGNMLSYELGMWSGFRIDNDTFDIHFDTADRVIDATVVQH